ncbi:hypothetical protein [Clostridium septicum]|uniref:Uncharacterized protein n=1 Tax=Clostridium septicum TaxID=1504 RepID=A0A9N7PKM1_CLOSE|nr:hypothetical protein [Clostridium septicum]AYE34182.1 hypothetical protein CP523_06705 [Clostridium septicum]QAS59545.1 hypothetical protein EI377_01170 [Clostridium septicum]UEC21190.1 hypothetical protein LK444_02075 [Clostridium septicum]USS00762.1 hypothetical protein NH397_15020 [Clostridium septicum]
MPDYKMDIQGNLNLSEYSNIFDYMGVVDMNDSFTITLSNTSQQDINIITSMLRDGDFLIKEQGVNGNGEYYINANKLK